MRALLEFKPKAVLAARVNAKAPAEPSEEDAYGCVEWFNYEQHPLSAAARAKARRDET
jgi:hypothetical protein